MYCGKVYSTVSFLLSKLSSILSCVFAAERNFYKGTADGHLRFRSRALVHGRCTVPHKHLDPR